MKIKIYINESFEYYQKPVFLIASPTCSFKCCKEAGVPISVCQNEPWGAKPTHEVPNKTLIQLYVDNPLTEGVAFGGLEPLDGFEELLGFIEEFRKVSGDVIIIYTGYREDEIQDKIEQLRQFSNIILKVGRYVPDAPSRYDSLLGVTLASDNQYAIKIS